MEEKTPPAPACPQCQSRLVRVPRRPGDRLISLFVPVLRCRCAAGICGWEGLVRRRGTAGGHPGDVYANRPVLEPSRGPGDTPGGAR